MIITITIILCALVALNFLLLTFSCNKVTKRSPLEPQLVVTKTKVVKAVKLTKQLSTNQLAPTGS
jgi:hypothetical protein